MTNPTTKIRIKPYDFKCTACGRYICNLAGSNVNCKQINKIEPLPLQSSFLHNYLETETLPCGEPVYDFLTLSNNIDAWLKGLRCQVRTEKEGEQPNADK